MNSWLNRLVDNEFIFYVNYQAISATDSVSSFLNEIIIINNINPASFFSIHNFWLGKFKARVQLKFTSVTVNEQSGFGKRFGKCTRSQKIQASISNHWPTLNIASPDLLSTLQNWHDVVIWDSTPPLIASDEGIVDRWSHTEDWSGVLQGEGRRRVEVSSGRGAISVGMC